jgi:hypothetical protein
MRALHWLRPQPSSQHKKEPDSGRRNPPCRRYGAPPSPSSLARSHPYVRTAEEVFENCSDNLSKWY